MTNKTGVEAPPQEEELLIDTSKMSAGQAEALQVAESARAKASDAPSFAREMFLGNFRPDLMNPFPQQSAADKKIGDDFLAQLDKLMQSMDAEKVDETRTIPEEIMDALKKMGAFAMKVPKEYGGLGFSQVNYNRAIHLVGSHCGSTAVLLSAHQSIGVPQPLKMFGTPEQKKKWLPRFREGAISAFALTEPEVGSDPAKMSTTAELTEDGQHYIINGQKLWCTNGPIADILVVMAKTKPKVVNGKERQQISALVVEKGTPGLSTSHRCDFMGLRAINNGLLEFKNVKVPKENLLWDEGRGLALALATLNVGRLTVPAACTGMAKQSVAIARRWGNKRVQWGDPIGYHEAGRQKVALISSYALAMEAVTWIGSFWADEGEVDIRIEAALGKLFCSEMAWRVADTTLQFRGGRGYERAASLKARGEDDPYPVERMMRDCRINTIIEGTSDIMRLFLAREVLDPHLTVAADLIRPKVALGKRIAAAFGVVGHYAKWYPKQWLNGSLFSSFPDMGALEKHYKYIDGCSHRLARTIFHQMAKHAQALEKQQVLLGHLTDIGMELYAMTATCAYAKTLERNNPGDTSPVDLADFFCNEARARIDEHFRNLSSKNTKQANKIAKRVLEGDMKWQENDLVWVGPKD